MGKQALTVTNFLTKKYSLYEFDGEWQEFLNQPENKGIWFVWGNSGSGKSTFLFQLAKYLSRFEKVLYNSLEEGDSKTMRDKIVQNKLVEVKDRFQFVCEPLDELQKRLNKRNSAQVVIIDSVPYTGLNWQRYLEFKKNNPNKTLIFVGQADGKKIKTKIQSDIMFDSYIKIWVEGYRAFSKGREIGSNGGTYTIWAEGAERYGHATNND